MQLSTTSMKAILAASSVGAVAFSDPTIAAAQTFLGTPANNALGGQIQVQITVDSGKITSIATPVTLSGRNGQYASYAVPILTQRALAAQSANIQGVSGASYVSAAWKSSLASAIANAGTAIGNASTPSTPAPAATPTPTKSSNTVPVVPAVPVIPNGPRFGGGDDGRGYGEVGEGGEGGEGGDDGYRTPRPERSHRGLPTPVKPTTPTVKPAPATPATPATPAAPTAAPDLGLKMGAGVIKKSITCVKGTLTKTVKAINPKCPTGYKLKK